MNPLKKLASQTAVYGVSSIVGRLLNFFLVPWYTRVFSPAQFGVVTEMYAFVGFLIIVLTYGLETGYFRFTNKLDDKTEIYSTVLYSILTSSVFFIVICSVFSTSIGNRLGYPDHTEYVIWFAIIVAFDAVSSIPLARLRQLNKAKTFMLVNLGNVGVNIGFNLFFLVYCKGHYDAMGADSNALVKAVYNPEIGVGYVFISNLIASTFKLLILTPDMRVAIKAFSLKMLRQLLKYSLPLMVFGLAGIVNETLDRTLLKHLLPGTLDERLAEVGIYGACYKVAILLSLAIQAFRYAAEPFFFSMAKEESSKKIYADIMKYYIIFAAMAFLGLTLFLDVAILLVGEEFRVGRPVIPILLGAYVFFGIMYNLSFWYKLSDKTMYGAGIAIFGATITIGLNVMLIPTIGYMGSAWATLACYAAMTIVSYFLGQKHYKINYDLKSIIGYLMLAGGLYAVDQAITLDNAVATYAMKVVLFAAFIAAVWIAEKPMQLIKSNGKED